MTTLAAHLPPHLPQWIRCPAPAAASHAAFDAWVHSDSGCLLLKLWYGCDEPGCRRVGCGYWRFEVVHPDRRRKVVWRTNGAQDPLDESAVLESAAAAVRELVAEGSRSMPPV